MSSERRKEMKLRRARRRSKFDKLGCPGEQSKHRNTGPATNSAVVKPLEETPFGARSQQGHRERIRGEYQHASMSSDCQEQPNLQFHGEFHWQEHSVIWEAASKVKRTGTGPERLTSHRPSPPHDSLTWQKNTIGAPPWKYRSSPPKRVLCWADVTNSRQTNMFVQLARLRARTRHQRKAEDGVETSASRAHSISPTSYRAERATTTRQTRHETRAWARSVAGIWLIICAIRLMIDLTRLPPSYVLPR